MILTNKQAAALDKMQEGDKRRLTLLAYWQSLLDVPLLPIKQIVNKPMVNPRRRAPRVKADPAILVADFVAQAHEAGLIRAGVRDSNAPIQVGEAADGGAAYRCHAPQGWGAVAQEMASVLGGQGRPSPSRTGASWQCGNVIGATLIDNSIYKTVQSAQAIVRSVIPGAPAKWSLGGLNRQLLRYVCDPQPYGVTRGLTYTRPWANEYSAGNADLLLVGIKYGYHECKPGRYDHAEHYDVSGFYHAIMCRLPSLKLLVVGDKIIFETMPDAEWGRWKEVVSAIGSHKPLRNAMAGTMAGQTFGVGKRAVAFARIKGGSPEHKGDRWPVRRFDLPIMPGPLRAAGLLIVRTGYEKTLSECRQNDTIYSNIDSVICKSIGTTVRSSVWEDLGFTVRNEWRGQTHIISRGNWCVGDHATENYGDGLGSDVPVRGSLLPTVQFGNWLL